MLDPAPPPTPMNSAKQWKGSALPAGIRPELDEHRVVAITNARFSEQLTWPEGGLHLERGVLLPWTIQVNVAQWRDFNLQLQWNPTDRHRLVPNQTAETESALSTLQLRNLGNRIRLSTSLALDTGQQVELPIPCQLKLGETRLEFWSETKSSFDPQWIVPLETNLDSSSSIFGGATKPPSGETLARWLESLLRLQRQGGSNEGFIDACTQSLIEPGGLQTGMMLQRVGQSWKTACLKSSDLGSVLAYPRSIVEEAFRTRRCQFSDVRGHSTDDRRCAERFAIAAPILGSQQQVAGMLVGLRTPAAGNERRGIRVHEAQFVAMLADLASSRLIASTAQARNARHEALLERAFAPEVAHRLLANPKILEPQTREVTLLFADLRDSTGLASQLAPQKLYEFLADIMETLTEAVLDHGGAVLDYYGDGMAAFWNAPLDQPEHARRAMDAAQEILKGWSTISTKWQSLTEQPAEVAIGIHTGETLVGNSGTSKRLKYGPRGEAVHLASRVEAAAKSTGMPIVASQNTLDQLPSREGWFRLGNMYLPGLRNPQQLHTVSLAHDTSGMSTSPDKDTATKYHRALLAYETGQDEVAAEILRPLDNQLMPQPAVEWLRHHIAECLAGRRDRRLGDSSAPFLPLRAVTPRGV